MTRNNHMAAAVVCGGATCCLVVCLFVVGIPTLIAGIVLITEYSDTDESPYRAGIVCIAAASVLMVIGLLTAILTCVFCDRVIDEPRVQNQMQINATSGTVVSDFPTVTGVARIS